MVQKVELQLKLPPRSPLMVQPPADHSIGVAALLHYTWASIFKDTHAGGAEVWKFDKRFFTDPAHALKVRTPLRLHITRLAASGQGLSLHTTPDNVLLVYCACLCLSDSAIQSITSRSGGVMFTGARISRQQVTHVGARMLVLWCCMPGRRPAEAIGRSGLQGRSRDGISCMCVK